MIWLVSFDWLCWGHFCQRRGVSVGLSRFWSESVWSLYIAHRQLLCDIIFSFLMEAAFRGFCWNLKRKEKKRGIHEYGGLITGLIQSVSFEKCFCEFSGLLVILASLYLDSLNISATQAHCILRQFNLSAGEPMRLNCRVLPVCICWSRLIYLNVCVKQREQRKSNQTW